MGILRLARVPAVTIEASATVTQGIVKMKEENVGTVFVVENEKLVGAFTERDVAFRVVLHRRNPETTCIRDVMTSPAWTLPETATAGEAVRFMVARRVRHLPIMSQGKVKGMVSLRHMLRERALELTEELDSIVAEASADGIGG